MIKAAVIALFIFAFNAQQSFAGGNCAHDLAMLYKLRNFADSPIFDFYTNATDRFINQDLKVATLPYGKTLLEDKGLTIEVGDSGRSLFLFHEFGNTSNSRSYAGILGPSAVNVRILEAGQEATFELERRQLEIASQAGFKVPVLFSSFLSDGRQINVYQYMHGPNFPQLKQMYQAGKISSETWTRLQKGYQKLESEFQSFTQSAVYRESTSHDFDQITLDPKKVIYYDDQWYILEF